MSQLLSIVIPAYREEKNISYIYSELVPVLSTLEWYDYEVIFVNDGSTDKTWQEIERLCKSDKRVKWVNLSRNFGHQAALTAWLDIARWDAVVSMDADMQDPPELIIKMLEKWVQWDEIVYARRKNRNDGFLKKYTAILYYKILSSISDTEIPRNVGDFRLVDRKVLDVFKNLKEKDRYIRGMFSWLWFRTGFVDFNRPERIHGETGYTWKKMLKLASDGILNFSTFPLKIGAFMGGIMIFLSLLFFLYVLQDALIYKVEYPLYKWLSIAGFGVMWLQFIFMWILGEYIWRIYNETRERPIYIVRERKNI